MLVPGRTRYTDRAEKAKMTQTGGKNSGILRLVSVGPTVFFVKEGGALLQKVTIVVENRSQSVEVILDVRVGSWKAVVGLDRIEQGRTVRGRAFLSS